MQEPRGRRVYLKVKIKSLAEEAKIIRREERRPFPKDECGYNQIQGGLLGHRVTAVRSAARHALLAYGFLRGKKYEEIERSPHTPPA